VVASLAPTSATEAPLTLPVPSTRTPLRAVPVLIVIASGAANPAAEGDSWAATSATSPLAEIALPSSMALGDEHDAAVSSRSGRTASPCPIAP
jgi:hypothetical protein